MRQPGYIQKQDKAPDLNGSLDLHGALRRLLSRCCLHVCSANGAAVTMNEGNET